MIKIICINNDAYIETREDLEEFSNLLMGETYDEEGELIAQCLITHFYEIWTRTQNLELDVKRRIDGGLSVITYLNFSLTDNLSEIRASLFSPNEFHLKKKEEIAFEKLFEMHFKSIKPLKDRLTDL